MCERCREPTWVRSESIDSSDGAECLWPLEDDDMALCCETAEVVAYERTIDEHLCEPCMSGVSEQFDDGLGDMLRGVGLADTNEFLPIREAATCDRCGGPATFAWVTIAPSFLCRAHAEENGCLPGTP